MVPKKAAWCTKVMWNVLISGSEFKTPLNLSVLIYKMG